LKDLTEECPEPTTLILCFVCHDADLKKDTEVISNEAGMNSTSSSVT